MKEIERFIRWKQVTVEHLGFSNNLFLTFSIGVLGFILNKNFIL